MTEPIRLTLFASSGVERRTPQVRRAIRRLRSMGFAVEADDSVRYRHQRFAGTDEQRVATLHRIADSRPDAALAVRGGYGMTRILDALDWRRLARSVDSGTQWIGYSDMTAFSLALLQHTGRATWHGPMATEDLGRELGVDPEADDANEVSCESLAEAASGVLEGIGFRTGRGCDGLVRRGQLWGGNLSMVCSLLGTPHWPEVKGGLLFLEDVGEHPYRVERMLLQLLQAGVLQRQSAILLGQFSAWKPSPVDRGYGLKQALERVRAAVDVPLVTGLPIGHVPLNLPIPQGRQGVLEIERQTAMLCWE